MLVYSQKLRPDCNSKSFGQRRILPKTPNKSAVERRMSLLWMAALNEAKRCLADPISRARYLATGSPHVQEDKKIVLPPEFLEQIFTLQMQAMEDPQSVQEEAQRQYKRLYTDLEAIFQKWEQDKNNELLKHVEPLLAKIKYIQNLINTKG